MDNSLMPLAMVRPGDQVTLVTINAGRGLARRLADMGLYPGVSLRVIQGHPGPLLLQLGAAKLALGHGIALKILVKVM
jgi:ferrous iron transport protein A